MYQGTDKAKQDASVNGSGNIIVQAAGAGIHVHVGLPHLTLIPPCNKIPRKEKLTEMDLLNPYLRAIALVGRERDMDELWQWLHSPKPIAIRTLTGRAGAGKTRAAIEIIERLDTERAGQWSAGFVQGRELRRFAAQQNLADWGWARPTLIVVDYAASLVPALRDWLRDLSQNAARSDGPPLRLLLLEREADAAGGWLQSLCLGGHSEAGVPELFDPLEPRRLNRLDTAEKRRAVLTRMLEAAAPLVTPDSVGAEVTRLHSRKPAEHESQNKSQSLLMSAATETPPRVPTVPAPGQNPRFDKQLENPAWEDPLYLMMAALLSLRSDLVEVLELPRTELALRLVDHEIKRLEEGVTSSAEQRLLVHLAAFASLGNGLSHEQALAIAEEESAALKLTCPEGPGALVARLYEILPAPDHGLAPVVPDILAEALVLRALGQCSAAQQDAALRRAVKNLGPRVVPFIVRTVQNFAPGGQTVPLQWLEGLIKAGMTDAPGLLIQISDAMPRDTVVLIEKAVEVAECLVKRFAKQFHLVNSAENWLLLSDGLYNISNWLGQLNRWDRAFDTAVQSLEIRQSLLKVFKDQLPILPDLARSLLRVADCLGNLGRAEEAVKKGQAAASLFEQLADKFPVVFSCQLGLSLHNLSNFLSDIGQDEAAREKAYQAMQIMTQLAEAKPEVYMPDLAKCLDTLATRESALWQWNEALEHSHAALRIREQLAQMQPDAFQAEHAGSLMNCALWLKSVKRQPEALLKAKQSVEIYRRLAATQSDVFLPDLANAESTTAGILDDLGHQSQALALMLESVGLYEKLATSQPQVFTRKLARQLGILSYLLDNCGKRDSAIEAAKKAAGLYDGIPEQSLSQDVRKDHALTLGKLAELLLSCGRISEAMAAGLHALRILRSLYSKSPAKNHSCLSSGLGSLSNILAAQGEHDEALKAVDEALRITKDWSWKFPQETDSYLARYLNNRANLLSDMGRQDEATRAIDEAILIYERVTSKSPKGDRAELANAFGARGRILHRAARHAESAISFRLGVETLTPLFLEAPIAFDELMRKLCRFYLRSIENAHQEPDMALLEPLMEIFEKLKANPPKQ